MRKNSYTARAFTIVELLIVIVIIGVLAAITIVSYSGITKRAGESAIQSDLANASKKLKLYQVDHGAYPARLDDNNCPRDASDVVDTNYCIKPTNGNVFAYSSIAPYTNFNLDANKGTLSYRVTDNSAPSSIIAASSFATAWGKNDDEYANGVIQTNDGGYIVTGRNTTYDAYMAKYGADGNQDWNRTWGGAGTDHAYGIVNTSDGGYAIAGYTYSFGAGNSDIFLAKYNASGSLAWSRVWGGAAADITNALVQTSDGGFAITGYTMSYGAGGCDMVLLKYNSDGSFAWNKTWGGASDEDGQSLVQTNDGGYAVTGETSSYGSGGSDAFLTKYDSSGNFSWNKVWGGTSGEIVREVIQTSDGGYAISGQTMSYGAGGGDILLTKTDSSGNVSWNRTWGGANFDFSYGMTLSDNGEYVIAGTTSSYGNGSNDIALVKFNSSGSLVWNKTWGSTGSESSQSVIRTSDGGYAVSGYTTGYGAGNQDMLLLKFKSDGSMNNCISPMCQSPSATVNSPTLTVVTPSATMTTPAATMSSPAATSSNTSGTITQIVAP